MSRRICQRHFQGNTPPKLCKCDVLGWLCQVEGTANLICVFLHRCWANYVDFPVYQIGAVPTLTVGKLGLGDWGPRSLGPMGLQGDG